MRNDIGWRLAFALIGALIALVINVWANQSYVHREELNRYVTIREVDQLRQEMRDLRQAINRLNERLDRAKLDTRR